MKSLKLLHRFTLRLLLGVAYVSMTLQWLWVLVVGLPQLLKNGTLDWFIVTNPAPLAREPIAVEPSPLVWVVAWIVTIAFVILTIVILLRLPRAVAKSGDKVVHRATTAVLPVITHHHKLPAKKRRVLSRRIVLITQLTLSIVPLVISLLLPAYEELTREIIITVSVWLAAFSLIGFSVVWLLESGQTTSRTRSRGSRE